MDITIIIPCYNEVDNIPQLGNNFLPIVHKLSQDKLIEVIFVDDGSIDGTSEALHRIFNNKQRRELSFIYEKHPKNLGLGSALRTGFAIANGNLIITTDSDGTYDYRTIPSLLSYLNRDADIVTASPYHPAGDVEGVPGYRLLLSKGSSLIYRILVNWQIHTYTALFRGYRREVLDNAISTADGYLAGTEILVHALMQGYRVVEFPTVLRVRRYGVSKTRIIRTICDHLIFQAKILRMRLGTTSHSKTNVEKDNA
jgi:dolichol-phosphate mannosyltransferase